MIPFVRDIRFEYGRVDQVSPLIRRVVANNPGPFTFTGTGTYIVGQGEVAVIDPGPDMDDHLDAILAAVAGETVTDILITHNHLDHSPLAKPLQAKVGGVIHGLPIKPVVDTGGVQMEAGHDDHFTPDRVLADGTRIAGKGWTFEAVTTPGHTSNHVCFALLEENCLFSGDHIMGWSTTVVTPPDGDMAAYFASLEKVKARGFSTLWPTHGPPVTQVEPFIQAYIDHRKDRERQIVDQLKAGHSRIKDMVPVMYAAVDSRLHPAAAMSVLGHMLQMVQEGRVVTEDTPGLDADYRLAG